MSEGTQHQQQERDKDDAEVVSLSDASDICAQLMERYSKSSAPQHSHLLASAVAMRSILESESLPLTPAGYFAAAISAIDNASVSDALDLTALSALLSFLAITLPLVPPTGISASNASEAVGVLVVLLGKKSLTVSTVRAAVKCLGILLGFCNLEDWGSVQLGFDTLLKFSVDRRPKVRRCAQDSLITFLNSLKDSAIKKEASKLVFSFLESCMPSAIKLSTSSRIDGREVDNQSNDQHLDVLHMLNVITLAIPLLSKKVRLKMLKELIKLVKPRYSVVTGHSFKAIELILKSSKAGVFASEVESIIVSIGSYLSLGDANPLDTVLTAATLLKCAMDAGGSSIAIRNLPVVCGYMTGLLTSDASKALHASGILKELIQDHVDQECLIGKDPCLDDCNLESIEVQAIKSTCGVFEDVLNSYDGDLGKYIIDVISDLFLKLGTTSFTYMKHILLKLAHLRNSAGNISHVDNLQNCVGSAVTAMGPEKILTLIPISINAGDLTVQNMWLIPILQSHVTGASLGYYLEYIVPLAKSFQHESCKVKKAATRKNLQTCAHKLWRLLPAFCRHPSDMHQSLGMLTELIITLLKEGSFMHEDIAVALQILVNNNTVAPNSNEASAYSKKTASKNRKALVLSSAKLLQPLAELFVGSVPTMRSHLKDTIGCLASITDSRMTKNVFVSLLERFQFLNTKGEFEEPRANADELAQNAEGNSGTREIDRQRCVMLELASAIIRGAEEDLIDLIYKFVKVSFQASYELGHVEAYQTLSRILEEHAWFASSRFSELVEMLIDLQSPADTSSQRSRFACFHILLVHSLKVNITSEEESSKAFLMLNEIIVALKSAEEDNRKAAYDVLHCISSNLKDLSLANSDVHKKFVAMILGYLSGASPHVKSGAISALSVLVYEDADIYLSIPDLVPSLLSLLQGKAIEVIKAVLGFVKVLVSSLQAKDLQSIVSDILLAALPWSSVSRHHFRSKVTVILEILLRKCGYAAIEGDSPDKYKGFIKSLFEKRHNKTSSKDAEDANTDVADSSSNGVRDKQHDGLETAPKKNVAGQYRKRKWEKPSGFIGRKNDDVFTEDGDRSKMIKRAAISSSKRSSTTDGFGDSRRADFSRHDAPGKAQQRGNKSGNKHQKERFGKPVKASKFYHKSSR
ncbi:RRP12-like protein [Cucurbita pepo subsp. pepo]|uniref:RRP12-like protein n=1 Tax=Cucurbita pepo subsp. pepo TaxID=3664 RepID=UPI000C9DA178|nr:RRP12-like protein [Cucurbita pepo subsp. pepo]